MKADKPPTGLSRRDWGVIKETLKVVDDLDRIILRNGSSLSAEVERLNREYCKPPPRETPPSKRRHFLKSKSKFIRDFWRSIVEQGELQSALQEEAADLAFKIGNFYASRLEDLIGKPPLKFESAAEPHFDALVENLHDIYVEITGLHSWEDRPRFTAFVHACARHVTGKSHQAISKWLLRHGY